MSSSARFRSEPFRRPAAILTLLAATMGASAAATPLPALMPVPAELGAGEGRLSVSSRFTFATKGPEDTRVAAALGRMLQSWSARTGTAFTATPAAADAATLVLEYGQASPAVPRLHDDESYELTVTGKQAVLRAPTATGIFRGLATFTQLFTTGQTGGDVPAVTIRDRPRFAWRGLMIDTVRHWQPVEVIKRNLDAMALVKLNVLHLHLTDDQGFRIESRTHPELHTQASDGNFYSQEQMRELLAYAHDRGIRVIAEFDIPGHATAWVVSHPELASAPGPYAVCRRWGIGDPVLDPTNEKLYPLLDDFIGEMAALFPDDYLHIGGDENNGVHWSANARIQEFIRAHGLKDNPGLHAWFNRRLGAILQKHGKHLVGWDEILHPDLPKQSVVHSWRGPGGIVDAARAGHPVILSNGYYIDLNHPASDHYLNDPLPADSPLTPGQQARILGGEATMWSEWASPDNIDTRIWPRTAAIAERLWSPRDVRDVDAMYRRLPSIESRLREAGALSTGWPRVELPGVDPGGPVAVALLGLAAVVEPVKVYRRGALQPDIGQLQPLNELADWAMPESRPAREFAAALEQWLMAEGPLSAGSAKPLAAQLRVWRAVGELAATAPADDSPRARGRAHMARTLAELCRIGDEAVTTLLAGRKQPADWAVAAARAIAAAKPNAAAVEFPFLPSLRFLIGAAASEPVERDALPRAVWRDRLEQKSTHPKP